MLLEAQRCLEELRELTRAFLGRVTGADVGEIEDFRGRRCTLIARLRYLDLAALRVAEETGAPPDGPHWRDTLQEVLALDRRLLSALDACRANIRGELQELGRARQALRSYRGSGPLSPAYLEAEG